VFFSSYNISVPNDSCCIISFLCLSGFGMLLLGKTQEKHLVDLPPTVPHLPPPSPHHFHDLAATLCCVWLVCHSDVVNVMWPLFDQSIEHIRSSYDNNLVFTSDLTPVARTVSPLYSDWSVSEEKMKPICNSASRFYASFIYIAQITSEY